MGIVPGPFVVLDDRRETVNYYRNLTALSKKGLSQIASGLTGAARTSAVVSLLNEVICSIIDEMDPFDLAIARAVIPAEIGAELQGAWVNIIGRGAAGRVNEIITEFARERGLLGAVKKEKTRKVTRTVL